MAIFECNLFSKSLYSSVQVNVILPTPDSGDDFFAKKTYYPEAGQKYQTLYLLHGFSADYTDWQRFSRIESYAQEKHLAVVLASANNSSYCDLPHGGKYFTFFTEELPQLVRAIFPLSDKREDNFIAGLSMGGFGSMKIGLLCPEKYAAIASLSGGLRDRRVTTKRPDNFPPLPSEKFTMNQYGENMEFFNENTDDLRVVLNNAVRSGKKLPKIYVCCGTEDFAYPNSVAFRDMAEGLGVDLTYAEGPGIHDFYFWDPYIKKILDWLPLKNDFVG